MNQENQNEETLFHYPLSNGVALRNGHLFFVAGPCVIEGEGPALHLAEKIKKLADATGATLVFKASYDKANRTSVRSFRGPGLDDGLKVLAKVRDEIGLPVLSDVHEADHAQPAAEVLDILQIPAFLCRQTDLLVAAAKTGKVVNIKKGQFLAPWDMIHTIEKVTDSDNDKILLTERGSSFGYNTLVTDFRSVPFMRGYGYPVVMDCTHAVQVPGGQGSISGGNSEYAPVLAKAGVAAGADGVFFETHENPEEALSDGPNMIPFDELRDLIKTLLEIHAAVTPS